MLNLQQGEMNSTITPSKTTKLSRFGWKIKLSIGLGLVLVLTLGYYYIYHSSSYLASHAYRINSGINDDITGFYAVDYPTNKRFFYYRSRLRSCSAAACEVSFFKSRSTFVENADPDSFRTFDLGSNFARDKNSVYVGIDSRSENQQSAPTLKTIPITTDKVVQIDDIHFSIGDDVYFLSELMLGAQASDYTFLESTHNLQSLQYGYVKSNNHIFKESRQMLAQRDGVFAKSIHRTAIPCVSADKQGKDSHTSKEDSGVAFCRITDSGESMPVEIDADSFIGLAVEGSQNKSSLTLNYSRYAKDRNYVYFEETYMSDMWNKKKSILHVVEGADPNTFWVEDSRYDHLGRDNKDSYIRGCKIYKSETVDATDIGRGTKYAGDEGYCNYY